MDPLRMAEYPHLSQSSRWNYIRSGDGHGHGEYAASGTYGSTAAGGSLSASGSTDSQWNATWDWNTKGDSHAELHESGSAVGESTELTWASSTVTNTLTGTTTGTTTSDITGSSETKIHSDSTWTSQKNWVGDKTGVTWTATGSGSGSGFTEKTEQSTGTYSWDKTTVEGNVTTTEVGYSSMASSAHDKNSWNHSYTGSSKSDGSSTLTSTSGGSEDSDWQNVGSNANLWTQTTTYYTLSSTPRESPPTDPQFDGEGEAKVIALRWGTPPAGYGRWTLRLLAAKVIVAPASYEFRDMGFDPVLPEVGIVGYEGTGTIGVTKIATRFVRARLAC